MNRIFIISIFLFYPNIVFTNEVPYTHIVRTKSELCALPKDFKNTKELVEGTFVTIIDSTKIIGFIYGKESPWMKIKTQAGDTGYLLLGEISTLKDYASEKKNIENAKNKPLPDLTKYISQSYSSIKEFDTLWETAEFIALDSNFALSAYVYDHNDNFVVFILSKIMGHNGQNPINKLTDVLVVDKRLFKNVSAVSLRDCKTNKVNETGSIIGVYSVSNQSKKTEFIPEKAWRADIKTGKIEKFPSNQCTCSTEPEGW